MSDQVVAAPRSTAARRPILFIAMCGVAAEHGSLLIDRKFHVGMLEFVKRMDRPLACLVPRMSAEEVSGEVDYVEVAVRELPYQVHLVSSTLMTSRDRRVMERAIGEAALVCVGASWWYYLRAAQLSRSRRVPYVVVSECTLRTELDIMRAATRNSLRRIVREARLRYLHRQKLRMVVNAAEIHANGYPTYYELGAVNPKRLLYFDTRALRQEVISEISLEERLASLKDRRPRIIYSGRYESIKGALDVVKVGIELDRVGFDFQLNLYGTGQLKAQMTALARESGARIAVHEPVPYRPHLIERTQKADLFLCCHVQGDPSCTYLETFACGVPIVGYANEMWSVLCRESGGGQAVEVGDYRALAEAVADLVRDVSRLREVSAAARRFALENTMEKAWDERSARLLAVAERAERSVA